MTLPGSSLPTSSLFAELPVSSLWFWWDCQYQFVFHFLPKEWAHDPAGQSWFPRALCKVSGSGDRRVTQVKPMKTSSRGCASGCGKSASLFLGSWAQRSPWAWSFWGLVCGWVENKANRSRQERKWVKKMGRNQRREEKMEWSHETLFQCLIYIICRSNLLIKMLTEDRKSKL